MKKENNISNENLNSDVGTSDAMVQNCEADAQQNGDNGSGKARVQHSPYWYTSIYCLGMVIVAKILGFLFKGMTPKSDSKAEILAKAMKKIAWMKMLECLETLRIRLIPMLSLMALKQ